MKKLIFLFMAVALVSSCGGEEKTEKGNKVKPAAGLEKADGKQESVKFAYVEFDSLLKNYEPYVQEMEKMKAEREKIEKAAASVTQNLEKKFQQQLAPIQQQVQSGKLDPNTAQQKAAQIQSSLEKEGQSAAAQYQKDLVALSKRDSLNTVNFTNKIQDFLKEYNKDNKYSMVFAKSGLNILYADEGYDITEEVLKGLNAKK